MLAAILPKNRLNSKKFLQKTFLIFHILCLESGFTLSFAFLLVLKSRFDI